jgi:hypothetical protein
MQALELVAPLTMLVVAPLGFRAATRSSCGGRRVSLRLLFACALPAAGSFALGYGTPAFLLTLPWLIFTAVAALQSSGGWRRDPALAASSLSLGAGSAALSVSRLGLGAEPLTASDERLLLVSMHCWYAGFAAVCFARSTKRALGTDSMMHRVSVAGIVGGLASLVTDPAVGESARHRRSYGADLRLAGMGSVG